MVGGNQIQTLIKLYSCWRVLKALASYTCNFVLSYFSVVPSSTTAKNVFYFLWICKDYHETKTSCHIE